MTNRQRQVLSTLIVQGIDKPNGWVKAGTLGAMATLRSLEELGHVEFTTVKLGTTDVDVTMVRTRAAS